MLQLPWKPVAPSSVHGCAAPGKGILKIAAVPGHSAESLPHFGGWEGMSQREEFGRDSWSSF